MRALVNFTIADRILGDEQRLVRALAEIDHYEHALASRLYDSLHRVAEISGSFEWLCIDGIQVDAERSLHNLKTLLRSPPP